MRVLHLAAGNLYGGVERIVAECASSRGLCPGMEPLVAVCFEGRLAREIDELGVACHRLGDVRASRPHSVWRARRRLTRILERDRPDSVICHSSWIHAWSAPALRAAGARMVLWLHDRVSGRTWVERWARRVDPDLVISNSRFTDASAAAVFPGVPRDVVYAPVAAGGVAGCDRRALRASLDAGPDTTVVLIASRLEAWKGHAPLIDALAGVRGDWRLWIAGVPQRAGEDDYRRDLERRVEAAGLASRVRWLGERRDIPHLMRAADVHCQPNSGPEPFGLAFIEALYAGLPVVTTAHGGALEIVTEECGVLVPPGDPTALRAALDRLVQEPRARTTLGAAGPARAAQLCDPARQLRALASAVTAAGRHAVPA